MSHKTVKKKLNDVFKDFIRLRDSNEHGIGQCISCGKFINVFRIEDSQVKFFQTAHAGHYYSRGASTALYFDEKNVNLQCVKCNAFEGGNIQGYSEGLMRKYGQDVLFILKMKKGNFCKMSVNEMELLIKYYNQEVKKQKEAKNAR